MPELVGFQTMVILDPNSMSFDAVCVFGPDFQPLFKSSSSYCGGQPDFLVSVILMYGKWGDIITGYFAIF